MFYAVCLFFLSIHLSFVSRRPTSVYNLWTTSVRNFEHTCEWNFRLRFYNCTIVTQRDEEKRQSLLRRTEWQQWFLVFTMTWRQYTFGNGRFFFTRTQTHTKKTRFVVALRTTSAARFCFHFFRSPSKRKPKYFKSIKLVRFFLYLGWWNLLVNDALVAAAVEWVSPHSFVYLDHIWWISNSTFITLFFSVTHSIILLLVVLNWFSNCLPLAEEKIMKKKINNQTTHTNINTQA